MKITKLILSGFRRLDLLSVDKIVYTPESPYQLILGQNGIGKSSLLDELSPLPCDSNDLRENGYKLVELEHRGHLYRLEYKMNKKMDCSFIRDDVELNDGRTIKIQKDLISEHLNYDTNIHNLLTGFTLLSNMTGPQRREWFVKMNKSDISFALNIYNKIKSAERDIKGAIKLNNQRLVSEQTQLPSPEDIERIKSQRKILNEELNHLLPFTQQGLIDYSNEIELIKKQLHELSMQFMDLDLNIALEGYRDDEHLNNYLNELKDRQYRFQDDLEKSLKELASLQDVYSKNIDLTERPLEEIDAELNQLRDKLSKINKALVSYTFDLGNNIDLQLSQYQRISNDISLLISSLPENPILEDGNRKYTREKYQLLNNKLANYTQERMEVTNKISYHERELNGLKEVHSIYCPKCNHEFKPGVDCQRIDNLEMSLKQQRERLNELNTLINPLLEEKECFDSWLNGLKQLRKLQEDNLIYTPLFKYLYQEDILYNGQYHLVKILATYHTHLKFRKEYDETLSLIAQVEEDRVRRVAAEGSDMEYIVNRMVSIEEHIKYLQIDVRETSETLDNINRLIVHRQTIKDKSNEISFLLSKLKERSLEQIRYMNNEKLKTIINEKQQLLAINETFFSKFTQSETIIQQLTKTTNELTEEQEALKLLSALLSPQDGLIAESLIGFFNLFLSQMGNVIDQIWSYKMLPYIGLEDGDIDLDYKIQVEVEGLERSVSDVSRLSRGQKEIMDFVFKLILMQHLDLQDYPLFMDEVGASFDTLHRDRLYRYIKLLVESNQVQQVFIISHIASSHDAFNVADRVVLDTDATIIDKEVNKVITFS